ncbi:MAG: multicopper oxidase domain-containing protein [Candidatus Nanopelagicales bacterium]
MWSGTSLIAIGTVSGLLVVGCAVHPDQGGRRALGDHHSAVVAQVADRDAAPWAPHQHRSVDDAAASALGATLPDWQPVAGQPLARIPVLRSHDGVLNVDLATVLETIQISGSPATTTPYNGMFTGPTLKVNPGDTVNVDLANESGLVTNIHYHGMHVSPKGISDNVFRMMESGRTYRSTIHIPADHETGLFWYHAHMHGNTDSQVFGGMRGLLVVGNIVKEHLPRRFAGITEHLFSVNDIFVKNGMVTNAAAMPKDSTLLMNSQLRPTWHMRPGETQLLRFANTGSDRFYNLKLPATPSRSSPKTGRPCGGCTDARNWSCPPESGSRSWSRPAVRAPTPCGRPATGRARASSTSIPQRPWAP